MANRLTATFTRREARWKVFTLVLILVVALTWWAARLQPPARLIGHARVVSGVTIAAPPGHLHPFRSWVAVLTLDPTLRPPMPEWELREGRQPGEGYELRWVPSLPGLQVWRGARPFLLGTVNLPHPPGRVAFTRRGARLTVEVDGRLALTCLDPQGAPESDPAISGPRTWTCSTRATLGDSTLTIQHLGDDRAWGADLPVLQAGDLRLAGLMEGAEQGEHEALSRSDLALLAVRHCLVQVDAAKEPGAVLHALHLAHSAIDPIPEIGDYDDESWSPLRIMARTARADVERSRLRLWLALARARHALGPRLGDPGLDDEPLPTGSSATGPASAETLAARNRAVLAGQEIDEMAQAAGDPPPPELTGAWLSLLPRLSELACQQPSYPLDPREVVERRRPWLSLLGSTAAGILRTSSRALSAEQQLSLRLLLHQVGCLRQAARGSAALGDDDPLAYDRPRPTPVDAPPWATLRWRAFALADPASGLGESPPLPDVGPVADAIITMERAFGLRSLVLCRLRAEVVRTVAAAELASDRDARTRALDDLDLALAAAPLREAALARALAALRLGDARSVQRAHTQLSTQLDGQPLHAIDPLAHALAALLRHRYPQFSAQATVKELPARLQPYADLLSGGSRSLEAIWIHDLPPAQAITAALAMQEALGPKGGAGPDWSLLRPFPSPNLPLDLAVPAMHRTSEGTSPEDINLIP